MINAKMGGRPCDVVTTRIVEIAKAAGNIKINVRPAVVKEDIGYQLNVQIAS